MAVAYATRTQTTGTAATTTLNVPASTVNGDLLITYINTGSGNASFTPPSGWTTLMSYWTDSNDSSAQSWYRVASSEPASYVFSWATSGDFCATTRRFTGANTVTPIRASRLDQKGVISASFTTTALAGVQATDLTVMVGLMGDDGGTTGYTVTEPGSPWTSIDNFLSTSKFQGAVYATGSQSGATWTSSSTFAWWNVSTFAIEAAVPPRPELVYQATSRAAAW